MAAVSTLLDNFNDNTISSALWTIFNGTGTNVFERNRQLELVSATGAAAYYGITSGNYDLTGSEASVKLVTPGDLTIATYQCDFMIQLDSNNRIYFTFAGGNIRAFQAVANVYSQIGGSVTYDSTAHKYLKIRESGGTVFFDVSADRSTWVNFTSVAVSAIWAVTAIQVQLEVGTNGIETTFTQAAFDDLNITPPSFKQNYLRPRVFTPGIAR